MKEQPKTLTPKLRFPEFSDTPRWETKALADVATFHKGKGLPKNALTPGGASPCIHYGELFTDYPEVIDSIRCRTDPERDVFLSEDNDVLMPTSDVTPRGLAKACCVKQSGVVLGGDILVIRPDHAQVDGEFLARQIRHLESDVLRFVSGSTVFHLYASSIKKLAISVPTTAEQRKIAACLTSLDELLAAEGRKLEALRDHKKGLMQQLFPREGETRPRLRFPEFRDAPEWKEKKLDELAKRRTGHTPNKAKPEYYNGGVKWVSLADSKRLDKGLIHDTAVEISLEGIENSSAVLHPAGSVILSRDAGVGKSAVTAHPMAVSQHFIVWICDNEKLSNWFLYFVLQRLKPLFEQIATGSTIKTIGMPFFNAMRIVVPSLVEQLRIAACLSSLDALITAQSKKLDCLRTHKKGLMQQLFPAAKGA
jgi:type I restriction enzyme S subunit